MRLNAVANVGVREHLQPELPHTKIAAAIELVAPQPPSPRLHFTISSDPFEHIPRQHVAQLDGMRTLFGNEGQARFNELPEGGLRHSLSAVNEGLGDSQLVLGVLAGTLRLQDQRAERVRRAIVEIIDEALK